MPENYKIMIGARDKEIWHYKQNIIFYSKPPLKGEWIITETTFNIEDLYVEDNKLSLLLNIAHLDKEEYKDYTIPIDWIEITIYKPGLIK